MTYTESATVDLEQIVRHASLDGSTVMVPAFFCRNVFERIFERHDLEPRFVDVDPDTYHLDVDLAADHVHDVDAILLLHTFGLPASMDRWIELSREADAVLIEDCARALGARYDDRPVGSFGEYAFFSIAKTTPLAFGGILASDTPDAAVDVAPAHVDADRILRTLYSVLDWEVPFEDSVAGLYDRLLGDGTATAPEIDHVDPPEADTVRRIDPINRWLFERFLRRDFARALERQAAVADELRAVLSRHRFDVQSDAAGRVNYVLSATMTGDRDRLVDYLRSRGHAVTAIWRNPWALRRGRDEDRFPVTGRLAEQIVSFLVSEMSMGDVRRLEEDLAGF